MFSTCLKITFNFLVTYILSSADAFKLDLSTILWFGKESKMNSIILSIFNLFCKCIQSRRGPLANNLLGQKALENIVEKGENATIFSVQSESLYNLVSTMQC